MSTLTDSELNAVCISVVGFIITYLITRWNVNKDFDNKLLKEHLYQVQRDAIVHWQNADDESASNLSGKKLIADIYVINSKINLRCARLPWVGMFDKSDQIKRLSNQIRPLVTKDFEYDELHLLTDTQRQDRIARIDTLFNDLLLLI